MLRPFHDVTVDFEQVRPFQGLEAEEVEAKVALEVNSFIQFLVILLDDAVDLLVEQRGLSAALVLAVVEHISDFPDGGLGLFPEVVDCDSGGKDAVVRMDDILTIRGRTM